jgi:MinD superfamily P-loop ATPase
MIKIAVASGKGGTGKTFVATNIFYSLLMNSIDAVLVDCDAEAPNDLSFFNADPVSSFDVTQPVPVIDTNRCSFCGKCHEYCNYNAIFILPPIKMIKVMDDLCHGCGACTFACGYGAVSERPVMLGTVRSYSFQGCNSIIEARTRIGVMSPVPVIKSAIWQAGNRAQIAILDSPPGTSCPFIQTTSASDYVILVTEPTPFGLSDLKQSIFTLRKIKKPYGVIINRSGLGNRDVYRWMKENKIPLLAEIPFDDKIARIYSEGRLLSAEDPEYRNEFFQLTNKIEHMIQEQITLVGNK